MQAIEVVRVEDSRGRKEFLELPYRLYRGDEHWVPPLRIAQKEILNTAKHPFYKNGEMQCFLAKRGRETVGRIAGILDRTYNDFQKQAAGFFGFFESIDDQSVATGLLQAARDWLRERGSEIMRGPVNPSTNYECGLLIEGFDTDPYVMMTYNPPYYSGLLERAGLRKAMDLLAYQSSPQAVSEKKAMRVAAKVANNGVRVRPIDMKNFDAEVERVWHVYGAAWQRNWGFAPMSREEFMLMGKEMKQILKPEFVLLGEVQGKVVGFALALPDINRALKPAKGKLFPFGLLKILYYQRLIRNLRVVALGVVEEYRTAGVAAAFYATLIRNARQLGYSDCEMSWILENNTLMNRSLEALGARRYKTYRIYEWD